GRGHNTNSSKGRYHVAHSKPAQQPPLQIRLLISRKTVPSSMCNTPRCSWISRDKCNGVGYIPFGEAGLSPGIIAKQSVGSQPMLWKVPKHPLEVTRTALHDAFESRRSLVNLFSDCSFSIVGAFGLAA